MMIELDIDMSVSAVNQTADIVQQARFLSLNDNPVLALPEPSLERLTFAIRQYAYLPAMISEFLARAAVRLTGWPPVKSELLRNLGEELGTRTQGATHLDILVGCIRSELGLDLPLEAPPGEGTAKLLDGIRSGLEDGDKAGAAGTIYALEATASPELKVVGRLVNLFSQQASGGNIVSEIYDTDHAHSQQPWTLDTFLAAHVVDFEVGHRDLLERALSTYLDEHNEASFLAGFQRVMALMEDWWAWMAEGGVQCGAGPCVQGRRGKSDINPAPLRDGIACDPAAQPAKRSPAQCLPAR